MDFSQTRTWRRLAHRAGLRPLEQLMTARLMDMCDIRTETSGQVYEDDQYAPDRTSTFGPSITHARKMLARGVRGPDGVIKTLTRGEQEHVLVDYREYLAVTDKKDRVRPVLAKLTQLYCEWKGVEGSARVPPGRAPLLTSGTIPP